MVCSILVRIVNLSPSLVESEAPKYQYAVSKRRTFIIDMDMLKTWRILRDTSRSSVNPKPLPRKKSYSIANSMRSERSRQELKTMPWKSSPVLGDITYSLPQPTTRTQLTYLI